MNTLNTITLVEGLCYLYPHMEVLSCESATLRGVWRTCNWLLKSLPGAVLAPLLVDDIQRDNDLALPEQTVDQVVAHTGRIYAQLPWFGERVLESSLLAELGEAGCKSFDAMYHWRVIQKLGALANWRWIVVHPVEFQSQQAGMLEELWKLAMQDLNLSTLANQWHQSTDCVRATLRENFLARFEHKWVDETARVARVTRPIYQSKRVIHQAA